MTRTRQWHRRPLCILQVRPGASVTQQLLQVALCLCDSADCSDGSLGRCGNSREVTASRAAAAPCSSPDDETWLRRGLLQTARWRCGPHPLPPGRWGRGGLFPVRMRLRCGPRRLFTVWHPSDRASPAPASPLRPPDCRVGHAQFPRRLFLEHH